MSRLFLPSLLGAAAFLLAWKAAGVPSRDSVPVRSPAVVAVPEKPTEAEAPAPASGLARREALLRRLESPSPAEARRLLEGGRLDGEHVSRVVKLWAERDPAGLWAWYNAGGREHLKGYGVAGSVFSEWFRQSPEDAMAAWRATSGEDKFAATSGLLYFLTGDDAGARDRVIPYLDEITATGSTIWHDPARVGDAAAKLLALPPGAGRDHLLNHTALVWMESDWKAATSWAGGLPEPLRTRIQSDLMAAALAPHSEGPRVEPEFIERALQWFNTEADPETRRKLGEKYVRAVADKDPGAALQWAQENLAGRPLTKAVASVLERQAGKDPAAARALVEALPPGGVKQRAAFATVGSPNAESVTWLRGEAEQSGRMEWHGVAAKWAFADAGGYRKYLESNTPESLPQGLVEGGMGNLIRKDAAGTLDWALRSQTVKTAGLALDVWGRQDAPAAAAWLRDHADAGWETRRINAVTGAYFQRSPAEAVDWAVTLPAGSLRDSVVEALGKSLAGDRSPVPPDQRAALEARLKNP